MRIVPINNNLSLKGSFQNSELMQKAVVHATTEELVKFNEILERAHLIDDKKAEKEAKVLREKLNKN